VAQPLHVMWKFSLLFFKLKKIKISQFGMWYNHDMTRGSLILKKNKKCKNVKIKKKKLKYSTKEHMSCTDNFETQ